MGLRGRLLVLWLLVITSLTGYRLLSIGWGSYKKFGLISCVRSAFGSVTFEACFMCIVIFCSFVCGGYFVFSLVEST